MPFDRALFELVNQRATCGALDAWAAVVRASELWVVPAVVTLLLVAWLGSTRLRVATLVALAAFVVGDATVLRVAKQLHHRPRPVEVEPGVRSVRLEKVQPRWRALARPVVVTVGPLPAGPRSSHSFPSGHAWNAFAVATVFTVFFRRWGWLAFLPALAIAHARVYAGLHYPSDVLASALASVPVTLAGLWLAERAARAASGRFAPAWVATWPRLLARDPA